MSKKLCPSQLIRRLWKFLSISCGCLGVQSQIAITKQKQKIENCLISDYLKIQVLIKIRFMLQATHLIICRPKSRIDENFRTAISRNKQNMFIVILLSFFMIYFANFIYSELRNSGRGILRALSNI